MAAVANPLVVRIFINSDLTERHNGWAERWPIWETNWDQALVYARLMVEARSRVLSANAWIEWACLGSVAPPYYEQTVVTDPLTPLPQWGLAAFDQQGVLFNFFNWAGEYTVHLFRAIEAASIYAKHWIYANDPLPPIPPPLPADLTTAPKLLLWQNTLATFRQYIATAQPMSDGHHGEGDGYWVEGFDNVCYRLVGSRYWGRPWRRMSWEAFPYINAPQFSPCGCVVTVNRESYAIPCRFGPGWSLRGIHYYDAKPGATVMTFKTPFCCWNRSKEYTDFSGVGEARKFRRSDWTNGVEWGDAPGVMWTGPRRFFGGWAPEPPIPTPPAQRPACDLPRPPGLWPLQIAKANWQRREVTPKVSPVRYLQQPSLPPPIPKARRPIALVRTSWSTATPATVVSKVNYLRQPPATPPVPRATRPVAQTVIRPAAAAEQVLASPVNYLRQPSAAPPGPRAGRPVAQVVVKAIRNGDLVAKVRNNVLARIPTLTPRPRAAAPPEVLLGSVRRLVKDLKVAPVLMRAPPARRPAAAPQPSPPPASVLPDGRLRTPVLVSEVLYYPALLLPPPPPTPAYYGANSGAARYPNELLIGGGGFGIALGQYGYLTVMVPPGVTPIPSDPSWSLVAGPLTINLTWTLWVFQCPNAPAQSSIGVTWSSPFIGIAYGGCVVLTLGTGLDSTASGYQIGTGASASTPATSAATGGMALVTLVGVISVGSFPDGSDVGNGGYTESGAEDGGTQLVNGIGFQVVSTGSLPNNTNAWGISCDWIARIDVVVG